MNRWQLYNRLKAIVSRHGGIPASELAYNNLMEELVDLCARETDSPSAEDLRKLYLLIDTNS
jgi:hypothetical protein